MVFKANERRQTEKMGDKSFPESGGGGGGRAALQIETSDWKTRSPDRN